jgi:probable HAF family extracellular repeat protein
MTTQSEKIGTFFMRRPAFPSGEDCGRVPGHIAVDIRRKVWISLIGIRGTQILLAIMIAAFCGPLAQRTTAQQYQVTYLDSLGGTRSRGNSINDREWIAGFSFVTGDARRHAALWRDGLVLDLGTLGQPERNSNVAWPVKNNRGFIAGISQTDTPEPNGETWSCAGFFGNQSGYTCLGFRWQNGVMTRLLPLTGGNNSFATGANNDGRVVGWAENGIHDSTCVAPQVLQFHPVIWGPGTNQPQDLPLISGDTSGAATAINNKGQIVGISGICDQAVGRYTAKHAVLWNNGIPTDIGNLGAELWITPMAINQHGDIVGFGATRADDLNGDFLRAFIWNRIGGIKQIDPLPLVDHVFSQATGLNESGQVVGSSCTIEGVCFGFLWQNGVIKDLNDPNVTPGFNGVIINAQDINDDGEITGRAFDPATGEIKAFVAVPVSEGAISKKSVRSEAQAKVVMPKHVRQMILQQRAIAFGNLPR